MILERLRGESLSSAMQRSRREVVLEFSVRRESSRAQQEGLWESDRSSERRGDCIKRIDSIYNQYPLPHSLVPTPV